ncbi:MAG: 50S ribosome-binding GTPase [Gammaproteobacteria bacterium]|nr:50S ribosome-binding GTPase [Gammaproteobacteria bacterium]
MNELFEKYYQLLEQWSESAADQGWISRREISQLRDIERQQAEAIFSRKGQRPLIVAFFGGTGVGKSSLLNRLAGEGIARTGVERPTSQEVTLYLHSDYRLGESPTDLPLEETRIAYHSDDRRRLIAWLDMPDFDSVEEHHQALVQAWLPYVDWLIYVVSPGRYQDDIGWRFVQQRGEKHSWLFVMNQWDRAEPVQLEHLRERLRQEGFRDPVILRTSCMRAVPGEDDFNLLEDTINDAIQTYGLELLQQLGVQARMEELQRTSSTFIDRLETYPLKQLEHAWKEKLSQALEEVAVDLQTNARLLVQNLPEESGLPWRRADKASRELPGRMQPSALLGEIWNGRVDVRTADLADELENLLLQFELPREPFGSWLQRLRDDPKREFMLAAETVCANTLLRPSGSLQRTLWKLAGGLSWGLPIVAAGWVVYHLVIRFYQGTQGTADFLGLDYAIHSSLLILLSWMLPWLLQRKLKPNRSQSVAQALASATSSGLNRIQTEGLAVLSTAADSRTRCIADLISIHEGLQGQMESLATKLPWSR